MKYLLFIFLFSTYGISQNLSTLHTYASPLPENVIQNPNLSPPCVQG